MRRITLMKAAASRRAAKRGLLSRMIRHLSVPPSAAGVRPHRAGLRTPQFTGRSVSAQVPMTLTLSARCGHLVLLRLWRNTA